MYEEEYDDDLCEVCGCYYDSELYIGCPHDDCPTNQE